MTKDVDDGLTYGVYVPASVLRLCLAMDICQEPKPITISGSMVEWETFNGQAMSIIASSIEGTLITYIMAAETLAEAGQVVKEIFEANINSRVLQLELQVHGKYA